MNKQKTYWAGFSGDKPFEHSVDDFWGGKPSMHIAPYLFVKKSEAQKRFEDVRKVKIVEVK